MLQRLQKESESSLTHEQIRQVVLDMNEKIKAQLKAIMSGGDEPAKNKVDRKKLTMTSKKLLVVCLASAACWRIIQDSSVYEKIWVEKDCEF